MFDYCARTVSLYNCLTAKVFVTFRYRQIRKVFHGVQYPWNVAWYICVNTGQFWAGTLDTPRNDTAHEKTLSIVRMLTKQGSTGISLARVAATCAFKKEVKGDYVLPTKQICQKIENCYIFAQKCILCVFQLKNQSITFSITGTYHSFGNIQLYQPFVAQITVQNRDFGLVYRWLIRCARC